MLRGLFEGAQYNSEAGAKCAVYSRARTKQGRGVIKEIRYVINNLLPLVIVKYGVISLLLCISTPSACDNTDATREISRNTLTLIGLSEINP